MTYCSMEKKTPGEYRIIFPHWLSESEMKQVDNLLTNTMRSLMEINFLFTGLYEKQTRDELIADINLAVRLYYELKPIPTMPGRIELKTL